MNGEQPVLVVESGKPTDDELVALVLALLSLPRPPKRAEAARAAVWALPVPTPGAAHVMVSSGTRALR
ncbi:hypothetical protein AB0M45_33090 [Nocardia sp. NPDC051787]|uniref:hypothetical protein n=1 Tax=Nocardia sp. NPDC051787 TaxID=3155415 RepID=UPI003435F758